MLPLLFALGLLAIGTLLLLQGADWFLDGAGDLARALGVSALVLGVLLGVMGGLLVAAYLVYLIAVVLA